jgi:uncharacterized membrane protein YbhN (UPF0104 family)
MLSYKTRMRGKHRLKSLLNLKTFIATIMGLIVLALLLSFSDISQVLQIISTFPLWAIPVLFGLFLGREILRSVQWRVFLNAIGIHASRREAFLSLAGGDAAQILPGGLYFQDLLISRELDTGISAPLGATTLTIWMEVTMGMLALAILGLPSLPLLRPIMAFCGVGSLVVLLLLHTHLLALLQGLVRRLERKVHRGRKLVAGLDNFVASFGGLSHPKVILTGLALCAAYLALTIYGFYLVCVNLHINIGIGEATAIYSLVLAIVDINPLPSDLGVSELTGVGGFLAFGYSAADGLAALLTFRISLLICEELVAAGAFILFHEETKKIFRSKKTPTPAEQIEASG